MTLVISVVSQDCVWQAVDRRLTSVQTGQPVSIDTNKAINYANCLILGYTGPSRLASTETPEWIADRLAEHSDLDRSVNQLPHAVEAAVATMPPRLRRIAIDGVGWKRDLSDGRLVPNFLRISNFIDDVGRPVSDGQFQVFDGDLKPKVTMNARAAGQPVELQIGQFWARRIKKRIKQGAAPADVGRCLVQFVRAVAATNSMVGAGVLVSAIPKGAAGSGRTLASMPMANESTFKYFPEGSNTPIDKGPEYASPGVRMSDFVGETSRNGDQSVSVGFRLVEMVD